MNEFEIGPSTLSPVYKPGKLTKSLLVVRARAARAQHPSLIQQRLWPQFVGGSGLPEPLAQAAGPESCQPEPVPPAIAARPSRTSPRQGLSQGFLPRCDRQAVERLAVAGPQPHPHPPADGENAQSVGRGAGRARQGGSDPARRHDALLHEPDLGGRRRSGAAADDYPTASEFTQVRGESADPLGEDHDSATPGLVHRYPDRVLLLAVDFCSTYCRYCTRSRVVGSGELVANEARLKQAFEYIRGHTEIRDCLISGGDPLSLGDDRLDWILTNLRSIPHLEFIRIGTKMPAVLPMRITRELCRMLRKHHPLWMSIHFTHPDECTPEAYQACARLADSGIPLGSQTVLLRGINDNVPSMKSLMHNMLKMRVRPYYLYQCDPITGSTTSAPRCRRGWRSSTACGGTRPATPCPPSSSTRPAAAARFPCCRTTSLTATAKTSCCGISRGILIGIPIRKGCRPSGRLNL